MVGQSSSQPPLFRSQYEKRFLYSLRYIYIPCISVQIERDGIAIMDIKPATIRTCTYMYSNAALRFLCVPPLNFYVCPCERLTSWILLLRSYHDDPFGFAKNGSKRLRNRRQTDWLTELEEEKEETRRKRKEKIQNVVFSRSLLSFYTYIGYLLLKSIRHTYTYLYIEWKPAAWFCDR